MSFSEARFKDFLRREIISGNSHILEKCKTIVESKGELSDATISFIAVENGITLVQSRDLWAKSVSFNNILIEKFGDSYLDKQEEVIKLTKKYQQNLVRKYKQPIF